MIVVACFIFGIGVTTALIIDIHTGSHHTGTRTCLKLINGPSSATPLFLFICENLAIIFYSEHVETKKNHCETTQDN